MLRFFAKLERSRSALLLVFCALSLRFGAVLLPRLLALGALLLRLGPVLLPVLGAVRHGSRPPKLPPLDYARRNLLDDKPTKWVARS